MPNHSVISNFIQTPVLKEILEDGQDDYIVKLLTEQEPENSELQKKLIRFGFLLLNFELNEIETSDSVNDISTDRLQKLFYLLRAININASKNEFEEVWGIEGVKPDLLYYFFLSISGLLSRNGIKARIELKHFELITSPSEDDWGTKVLEGILKCIVLLVRKSHETNDIGNAIALVDQLKSQQSLFENKYLKEDSEQELQKAHKLLGYYHICKILTETANYLSQGYDYENNLLKEIQRHRRLASEILASMPRLCQLTYIIELTCLNLQQNSIWYRTMNLGSNITKLCRKLGNSSMIDLLPSQQEALSKSLLDPASSVTVVQMPTSAGKTLLAEFSILQTKALDNTAKIVYVVPTRALTNQTVSRLREDFDDLNYTIEKSTGASEVDPTEDQFLNKDIDVLVATPEKLDLLIRKRHPSVDNISLVVIDEAHNIKDGARGARLELLLSILRREKPNSRFLLLSPFLPNAELLKSWLAEGKNAIPPIKVDWKPSDKLFIGLKEYSKRFELDIIPSAYGSGALNQQKISIEKEIEINSSGKKERLMEFASKHFGKQNNSILYLCWGKKSADNKAKDIARNLESRANSERISLVKKFIDDQIGEKTTLSSLLDKGVAVHHAGLTDDIKYLVEYLVKKNEVKHLCATTTIAQGINFPISTIYIDDVRKGSRGRLSSNEFQNITGRAGRTLVDSIGRIVFPFNSKANSETALEYVSQQSQEIKSALVDLLVKADEIISTFSTKENAQKRAKLYGENEALSSLVQYLVHILNVSGDNTYADEIEDLFKDSLGYYSLNDIQKKKFLQICHALYKDIGRQNKGILKYADKTGFSISSIIEIVNSSRSTPEITNPDSWNPEHLFNPRNQYMTEKISVIGRLREVSLGTDSQKAPFNPENVAKILIGWVNGDNLSTLSRIHPTYAHKEEASRMNDFITYLSSTIFKSSWGLSALEGVVKSDGEDIAENTHIPSFVYYGVNSPEAVTARMLGVPRTIASNLAGVLFSDQKPTSYNDARQRISSMSLNDWDSISPKNSSLNGAEWKEITKILMT